MYSEPFLFMYFLLPTSMLSFDIMMLTAKHKRVKKIFVVMHEELKVIH